MVCSIVGKSFAALTFIIEEVHMKENVMAVLQAGNNQYRLLRFRRRPTVSVSYLKLFNLKVLDYKRMKSQGASTG